MRTNHRYIIGIDSGVNTGFAIWDKKLKEIVYLKTIKIHTALTEVKSMHLTFPGEVYVRVEDARKRKWFGNAGREQLQGAGSIKRDATIWEDFLTDHAIDFEMVAPKNNKTKVTSEYFKMVTGWKGSTNVHNRDAAMLVYGF